MTSRITNVQIAHNCKKSLKRVRKLKIIDSLIRCLIATPYQTDGRYQVHYY